MTDRCRAELRNGKLCMMPDGHTGRHSSVVFDCDLCGNTYRGRPFTGINAPCGHETEPVDLCWLCSEGKPHRTAWERRNEWT